MCGANRAESRTGAHRLRELALRHEDEVGQDDLLYLLLDDVIAQVEQCAPPCAPEEKSSERSPQFRFRCIRGMDGFPMQEDKFLEDFACSEPACGNAQWA